MKVTLFADGGSRGNPGPSAFGVVIYDEHGTVIREIAEFIGIGTNNVAEWSGLIAGLAAALELGATDVAVRLDSELVVRQLSGQYRVKDAKLIPLAAQARSLLRRFHSADIAHVRRKENAAADALANQALDANAVP